MDDSGQIIYKVLSGTDVAENRTDTSNNEKDEPDLSWLCRICGNTNEYLIPIFEGEGQENNLAEKIHSYLPIKVNALDNYPDHVCYQCASTLLAFHDLVDCCVQANDTLTSRIQRGHTKKKKKPDQARTSANQERYQECGRHSVRVKTEATFEIEETDNNASADNTSTGKTTDAVKQEQAPHTDLIVCNLTSQQLKDHFHRKEKAYSCHLCIDEFVGSKHFLAHIASCSETVCKKCRGKFSMENLLSHEDSCSIFYCNRCPKRFISSETLKIHQLSKHDPIVCEYCCSNFPTDAECETHKTKAHHFTCEVCLKTFENSVGALKYRFEKSNDKVLCSLCYESIQCQRSKILKKINKSPTKVQDTEKPKPKVEHDVKEENCLIVPDNVSQKSIKFDVRNIKKPVLMEDDIYVLPTEENMTTDNAKVVYVCFYCQTTFSTFPILNDHLKDKHNIELQEFSALEEEKPYQDALEKYEAKIDELFDTAVPLADFQAQPQYKCLICDKSYCSFSTYCKHVFRAHKINVLLSSGVKYRCYECRTDRNNLKDLNNHLYHRHETILNCEYCEKIFASRKDRKIHILTDHPDQPAFTCIDCSLKFSTHDDLKQHCSWHWFHEIVDCKICNKKIKGKKKFKVHMHYHKIRISESGVDFSCPECGKTLSSKSSLHAHMRFVHQGGQHENILCGECGILVNARRFSRHHDRMHSKGRIYRCLICPRAFFSKELLRQHSDTHVEGRPHECDQCPAAFKQLRNLRVHTRNFHSEPSTTCKLCDLEFDDAEAYAEHRQLNHKRHVKFVKLDSEEGFQCSVCPKILKSSRAVATHMRIAHEQHLHVSCNQCSQKFPFVRQLQNHMATHNEPKPDLSCSFCHKTFTTLGSLNSHIKWVHIGERNFPCTYCPAKFKRKDAQVVHERTHTDERPYSCNICQRRFRQRTDCKRHEAKHSVPGFRYNKPHRSRPPRGPLPGHSSNEVVIEEVVEGEALNTADASDTLMLLEVPTQEDQQAAAFLSYIVQN